MAAKKLNTVKRCGLASKRGDGSGVTCTALFFNGALSHVDTLSPRDFGITVLVSVRTNSVDH